MMRRPLRVLAGAALALLAMAVPAGAGERIESGQWRGSYLNPQPGANTDGQVAVTGSIRNDVAFRIAVSYAITPSDGGCEVAAPPGNEAGNPRGVSVPFTAPCNGRYNVRVNATSNWGDHAFLDQTVTVAMPAPVVTGVGAVADGRHVTVTWDDMRPAAPDLSGYVVERSVDGGSFTSVALVSPDDVSVSDSSLPPAAGVATYQVKATRPAPGGETKVSAASQPTATPYAAAPIDPATGEPVPDAGDPGDPGTGTDGEGAAPGAAPGAGGVTGTRVNRPRIGISGSFFPPLLRPNASALTRSITTTSTTIDDGFGDELPYDEAEQGDDDPVLPDDELAIVTDSEGRRGMLVPVATALVLAVWAIHLRMLARAARPIA